jgi:hypothetical protein
MERERDGLGWGTRERREDEKRTITQFLPISTQFPMCAASTMVLAPMWTLSPILTG